jgi:anti-sigma B factor antagonist
MKSPVTIVSPQGRLDAAGVRPLETELLSHLDAGRIQLIVDLSGVRYISSVGLRMFLTMTREANRRGGVLKLCGLNTRVMDIFKMAGFDQVLQILSTLEEAQRTFL